MSPDAKEATPHDGPVSAASPASSPAWDEEAGRLQRSRRYVLIGGLVAGLVAFGLGEALHELIPARLEAVDTMGHIVMAPTVKTSNIAATWNGAIAVGALGVCLGGALGIAGGLARRSVAAAVKAGLSGAVLGAALAAATSLLLVPYFLRTLPNYPDLDIILSMIMHGTIWGSAGAAGGLAFALGRGERNLIGPAVAAGLVGAVFGAVAFDLIGGALFPLANTGQPISSTWSTRFLARMLVPIGASGALGLTLPKNR